jgi:hypothetical protein
MRSPVESKSMRRYRWPSWRPQPIYPGSCRWCDWLPWALCAAAKAVPHTSCVRHDLSRALTQSAVDRCALTSVSSVSSRSAHLRIRAPHATFSSIEAASQFLTPDPCSSSSGFWLRPRGLLCRRSCGARFRACPNSVCPWRRPSPPSTFHSGSTGVSGSASGLSARSCR